MNTNSGLVPLLDETGRFPNSFAPPSVEADMQAARAAQAQAEEAAQNAAGLATTATTAAETATTMAGQTVALQDAAISGRIADSSSETATALAQFMVPSLTPAHVRGNSPSSMVLSLFQTGHPFTLGNSDSSSNANDKVNYELGTQCATLVTKGNGTVSSLGAGTMPGPADLTGMNIRIRMRAANLEHISRFEIYAGNESTFNSRYTWGNPASDFKSLLKAEVNNAVNIIKDGEWANLDLSLADATVVGTPDKTAINSWQLRIADDTTSKVTINFQGLYTVAKSTTFPTGVVTWAWDDSHATPLQNAKPWLDMYGMRSTYYLILDVMGKSVNGDTFFTIEGAHALYDQGNDIAPHCTTLARHSSPNGMIDLTDDELEQEFRELKLWFRREGFTRSMDHFATPQGKFTPRMISVMQRYFASHRSVVHTALDTIRPGDTMRLHCIPLPGLGTVSTVEKCKAAVRRAVEEGAWIIFMGHKVVTGASNGPLECTTNDFQSLCSYVNGTGIPVRTVSEVLDQM